MWISVFPVAVLLLFHIFLVEAGHAGSIPDTMGAGAFGGHDTMGFVARTFDLEP